MLRLQLPNMILYLQGDILRDSAYPSMFMWKLFPKNNLLNLCSSHLQLKLKEISFEMRTFTTRCPENVAEFILNWQSHFYKDFKWWGHFRRSTFVWPPHPAIPGSPENIHSPLKTSWLQWSSLFWSLIDLYQILSVQAWQLWSQCYFLLVAHCCEILVFKRANNATALQFSVCFRRYSYRIVKLHPWDLCGLLSLLPNISFLILNFGFWPT